MNTRYLCVHGHFYQPPRENPWIDAVEREESAYPFHDWNERITAECYGANAASRILGPTGRVAKIVNNYSRMSFNFGPTLLSWLEKHSPDTYARVLEADRDSRAHFQGHGSAMAQVYNHIILPLANARDKQTQIRWGIEDFRHRFGRDPEGMWLAETAADTETLEALAENGIRFTVLAPHQARQMRRAGSHEPWQDVSGGRVDPRQAYWAHLPSGRKLALFFYDGPVSQAIAFEHLLVRGENFVSRLMGAFDPDRTTPQLVHVATDGETYGHHHRYGDMALAWSLADFDARPDVELVNYGLFLERVPPEYEIDIVEPSSWSCSHGVERWRSDCGCKTGGDPRWNQQWRAPLRNALDSLRDKLAALFEREGALVLNDPWLARDGYIHALLRRGQDHGASLAPFLLATTAREVERARTLLEMQRYALLMFTSCGWFFDEISGIESTQVLRYAARAIELAKRVSSENFENEFLAELSGAQSNLPEFGNGRDVYDQKVRPAVVAPKDVAVQCAAELLFDPKNTRIEQSGFHAQYRDSQLESLGAASLAVGRLKLEELYTGTVYDFLYGALHLGDHNLLVAAKPYVDSEELRSLISETSGAFLRGDWPSAMRAIDTRLGAGGAMVGGKFRDEHRERLLKMVTRSVVDEVERSQHELFTKHVPLIRFLVSRGVPLSAELRLLTECALNGVARSAVKEFDPEPNKLANVFVQARELGVRLDIEGIGHQLGKALESVLVEVDRGGETLSARRLQAALDLAEIAREATMDFPLQGSQEALLGIAERYAVLPKRMSSLDLKHDPWFVLERLGECLGVQVEAP